MLKNKTPYNYTKIAIILFFISAFYGWLMRLSSVFNIPFFDYSHFLQAHSHVTFLGWGFIGVTTLFNFLFLSPDKQFNIKYKWLFGIKISSICLMLISFPIQGYKVFSIILLSIFLISSYVYIYSFVKDYQSKLIDKSITLFIKSSLFFYSLSSIGIWAIGITVATQGKTDLYYNSIYFYLHFLYNGFFVFALFGLFFFYLTRIKINIKTKSITNFFWITALTCLPAYTLSLVKSENQIIISIGFIVGSIQLFSIYYLIKFIKSIKTTLNTTLSSLSKLILSFVFIAFSLKIILQFSSSFPQLSQQILLLKSYFVIGYIHLVTLGFLSPFLFFLLDRFTLTSLKNNYLGVIILLIGILMTELILFTQGTLIWFYKTTLYNYNVLLFIVSSLLLIGIFSLISFKRFR